MKKLGIITLLLAITLLPIFQISQEASAAYCSAGSMGRAGCVGYFTGNKASAKAGTVYSVFPNGLKPTNTKADFLADVKNYLDNGSAREKMGARFVISVIMGLNGPGYGGSISAGEWTAFRNLINDASISYDNSVSITRKAGSLNSAYFSDINDDAFHSRSATETFTAIHIWDAAGHDVYIERSCGNFVGTADLAVEEKSTATITPKANGTIDINVGSGAPYYNYVDVSNVENTDSDNFDWTVTGQGPTGGANVNISGANPRVPSPYNAPAFGARGSYDRTISVSNEPAYASVGPAATQRVNVRGWSLSANSGVTAGGVGSEVTFTHSFTNTVTVDATDGDGAPTHVAVSGNVYTGGGGWVEGFSQAAGLTRGLSRSESNPQTFDQRGTYCQYVTVSNSTETAGAFNSAQACVVIAGWDVNADSRVAGANSADGRSRTIYRGQTATFNHRLWTTGDPLHKFVDGDVVISSGDFSSASVSNECISDGTGPNNCWNYRYADSDGNVGDSDNTASRTYTFNKEGTYCENLRYNPSADNDATPAINDYPNYTNGTAACVYVIDPVPTISSSIPYEKNESGLDPAITFTVAPPSAYCPPPGAASLPVTLSYTILFPGPAPDLTGTVPGNWGGAAGCAPIPYSVTTFTSPLQKDELNNAVPGTPFKFKTRVVETGIESGEGNITVEEVPFTRFYGNDLYSRSGTLRFNASPSFDTGVKGRGSVSQYAAFSGGANVIATAAFRYNWPTNTAPIPPAEPLAPTAPYVASTQPPGALNSSIAATKPADTIPQMIEKIQLPDDCWPVTGNTLNLQAAPRTWGSLAVYQKQCYKVAGPGPIDITPSGSPWSYRGKYTIKTADTVDMYISQDFTNNTSSVAPNDYQDPSKTGVLLLISGGDVYIHKNVTRIDAIILAKGTIYTCAENGSSNIADSTQRDNECRNTNLTINGAVAAPAIRFERSVGTRLMSDEQNLGGTAGINNIASRAHPGGYASAANTSAARNRASETVNFPTYLYFARPYLKDTSNNTYTALFNAAPRL